MLKLTNPWWLLLCLLLVVTIATAAPVKKSLPKKAITSLEQAIAQVQADSGGRVLAADTIRSRHGSKYRIKVLTTDGRVRVIEVSSTPAPKPDEKGTKHNNKEKH